MNESADPSPVVRIEGFSEFRQPRNPLSFFAKKVLACNPLYLVSAAVLLWGIYQVSVDPKFLRGEVAQLVFNLGALEIYELLLVITAVCLASRRIWYDAGLLVGLENMLVFVPFILVSQAALISQHLVWLICVGAGLVAGLRFAGLKRFVAGLNFPRRFLVLGTVVLAVNVFLPVLYRALHENKVGTRPDWGAAYITNEFAWSLLLPVLCGLANLLPPPSDKGLLGIQRRWVPLGAFALWLAATGVHLYCLGYVYDFSLRPELLAPAFCVACWTLRYRLPDFAPGLKSLWGQVTLVPPLLVSLLAIGQTSGIYLQVSILNAAIYGAIAFHNRQSRFVIQLFLLSLVCIIAGWPGEWTLGLAGSFTRANCIGLALLAYLGSSLRLSRDPKFGVFLAVVAADVVLGFFRNYQGIFHWAVQAGFVVLLIHSLRWDDTLHRGGIAGRFLAAVAWVAHAIFWIHLGGPQSGAAVCGVAVFLVWAAHRVLCGRWGPFVILVGAVLVTISSPGHAVGQKVHTLPFGLALIAGSFLLFGLGTLLALTRERWLPTNSKARP